MRRVLLLMWIVVLTGCTNMKQINRITFITALGIDKSGDGVKVYALAAVPGRYTALSPAAGGGPAAQSPNYILTEKGRSVSEALFKMKRKSARDIQFGHTEIVLFSEEMAKQGLNSTLDLFMRRTDFQLVSYLGITKGSTEAVLKVTPETPETLSDALVDVFSQAGSDTPEIIPLNIAGFYALSVEAGQSPYIMMVKESKKGNKIEVSDLALFKRDHMVGKLSSNETKILHLLQKNKVLSTSFTVEDGTLSLLKYKVKIKVSANQINVHFELELEVDQSLKGPLKTSNQLQEMAKQVDVEVKKETEQLITKLQDMKTDPVGFGNQYRTAVSGGFMNLDAWENELFPKMSVNVIVKTIIQGQGTIE